MSYNLSELFGETQPTSVEETGWSIYESKSVIDSLFEVSSKDFG